MKKNIMLSLLGLVIGGVASYLYCRKRFEEGFCGVESVEKENDEIGVRRGLRRDVVNIDEDFTNHGLITDDVIIDDSVKYKSYPGIKRKERSLVVNNDEMSSEPTTCDSAPQPRSYHKIVKKLYEGVEVEYGMEPRVITECLFHDLVESFQECENYDKITVLYYENGIILDEHGDIIDDVDDTIGIKNLPYFGYGSSDKDALYVRNDRLKILYEVLRQNTEYNVED